MSMYEFINIGIIVLTLILGGLCSALETATVVISEYRLKSLQDKYLWAKYAYKLKLELNKILIFSLFGNSLANATFTTLSTLLLAHLLNNISQHLVLPIATLIIAFFIIVFSEALPKIIAAKNPIAILKLAAIPAYYIFIFSKPLIFFIEKFILLITNFFNFTHNEATPLEEIREIIADKRSPFQDKHRLILLNSINLNNILITEVLIPLRNIQAINIDDDYNNIIHQICTTHHTRIIVYQTSIDNIIGFLHIKDILSIIMNKNHIIDIHTRIQPIDFIHDFIPIVKQIHQAQKLRHRIFVVMNEYGDTLGIACLEDMLEIIFGDFTTEVPGQNLAIKNANNELIVDGTILIRDLNELYNLNIDIMSDALTINGLIFKVLNGIPNTGVCFKINNLVFEIINVGAYWVERVKIITI